MDSMKIHQFGCKGKIFRVLVPRQTRFCMLIPLNLRKSTYKNKTVGVLGRIAAVGVILSGSSIVLAQNSQSIAEHPAAMGTENPLDKILSNKQHSQSPCPPICDSTGRRADSVDETNGSWGVEKAKLNKEPEVIDVLELEDMEVRDVLKLIAQKSGLSIVAGQNVQGKVTIYLKGIEVKDALRIILDSNDLAYMEDNGVIRVMTAKDFEAQYGRRFGENVQTTIIKMKNSQAADLSGVLNQMKTVNGKVIIDEKSNTLILMDAPDKLNAMEKLIQEIDVPWKTEVFDLSYAQVEDLAAKINEALTTNVGKLKFDKRSNRIVVTDTAAKIEQIRKIIQTFDQKEQEVLIEAKIVQIVLNDEHKMGVDWEAIVSDYHSLNLKNSFNILGNTEKSEKLSVGTISKDDYSVLLEALDTVGKTNILSSLRVRALNNKEAKILVGSTEEPYVTTTTTTHSSGPTTTTESANFIEVGVKLHVTPMVHQDGFIAMKIQPELSAVTRNVTTGNNHTVAVVETSEAETTVTVQDGVTIVLGGLIKDEKIESIKKIPLLGDLPLVGFAFRNEGEMLRRTELVIFLTPRIISGEVQITPQAVVAK